LSVGGPAPRRDRRRLREQQRRRRRTTTWGIVAGAAVLLLAWCAGVVETVDNVLRPRLVGKDTQLPALLVLLATLGGILLFGAAGVIIGPIVAALLITVWDIYGAAFKDVLPPVPEAVAPKADAEPKG